MPQSAFDPTDYWNARHLRYPGLEGVGFIGLGAAYNSWLYKIRGRSVRRLLRRLDGIEDFRVFDVGSGGGFYLDIWHDLGVAELVGSDISDVAVQRLRERFPGCEVVRLDISAADIDFDAGTFDVISAFDLLFHIVDDSRYRTACRNVSRLLRPGGWFCFSENFVHTEAVRYEHQVSRPLAEIEECLRDVQLEMVVRRPMMNLMNSPVDSMSELRRRLWGAISRSASRHELAGWVVGAALFPLELAVTRWTRESPSTEVCLCRKSVGSADEGTVSGAD
jgi:SAM-dependent methyltransferase